MEELKEYHNIIQEIWKTLKASMLIAAEITSPTDPRWVKICMNFDRIYDNAPADMKDYTDSMVKMHIYELERRWRH